MSDDEKGVLPANWLVLGGVALAILYWLAETILMDVLLLREGSVVGRGDHELTREPHEIASTAFSVTSWRPNRAFGGVWASLGDVRR